MSKLLESESFGGIETLVPTVCDDYTQNGVPLRNITNLDQSFSNRISDGFDEPRDMMLPALVNANDLRELVQYLKKRPSGVNVFDVVQPIKKRIFYPPKVAAYEFWGIINRNDDHLALTPLGWEFAKSLEPEMHSYRRLIANTLPYKTALQWIRRRNSDVVTETEIAVYWQEEFSATLGRSDARMVERNAVCFFHLCQAAELGSMTIGKRGQPARIHFLRAELTQFLKTDDMTDGMTAQSSADMNESVSSLSSHSSYLSDWSDALPPAAHQRREEFRIYISYRQWTHVVEQLQETLKLCGLECEFVDRSGAASVHGKTSGLDAMRNCRAGIIVITEEDCLADSTGLERLTDELLLEIGTASIYAEQRILLLWDEAVSLPEDLRSLRRCRFNGDSLTWDSGIELMRIIKTFAAASNAHSGC